MNKRKVQNIMLLYVSSGSGGGIKTVEKNYRNAGKLLYLDVFIILSCEHDVDATEHQKLQY